MQLEPELIEGSNGIFDVVADGTMLFSKYEESRFPEPEEIIEALRQRAPDLARRAMDAHLRRATDDLLRVSEAEFAGEVDEEERRRGQRAVAR